MEVALLVLRILSILLLYVFLGVIVVLLWRDMQHAAQRETASTTRVRPARLVLLNEDGTTDGVAYELKPFTSLGRAPSNTIELNDTYCSAEHALLLWRNNQWWLEDRGSRNGTQLNDISVDTPVVVGASDIIRLGRVHLRFEVEEHNGGGN
ncbi:MAG TPA: FHA domain-containing protein [Anaerolineae bacterium]|nr:FHA domain-containing protein [Anaerolineae bacterium]